MKEGQLPRGVDAEQTLTGSGKVHHIISREANFVEESDAIDLMNGFALKCIEAYKNPQEVKTAIGAIKANIPPEEFLYRSRNRSINIKKIVGTSQFLSVDQNGDPKGEFPVEFKLHMANGWTATIELQSIDHADHLDGTLRAMSGNYTLESVETIIRRAKKSYDEEARKK